MPEEVTTDVKDTATPEPSTGQTITPPSDPEAYSKWRLTGEVAKKPKKETSASSHHSAEAESGSEHGSAPDEAEDDAPASEPGKKQEHRKGTAESRLSQILADLKRAGLSPSELKTFKREAQQAPPAAQPPAQQTSVNPPPQQQPKPLTEPKLEDFKTWDEFNAAQRSYADQRMDSRFQEMLAQHQVQQQANQRLVEAKQRYGDEAEGQIRSAASSLFGDQSIHPVIKGVVNESPVIADLLYVMGSNADELQQFIQVARTNPGEALRRAVVLEQIVKDELSKRAHNGDSSGGITPDGASNGTPERDESGRFIAARKEAPPPAREVSGRATAPGNEVDAAFARGDVRSYMNAANRRDIAARKGR